MILPKFFKTKDNTIDLVENSNKKKIYLISCILLETSKSDDKLDDREIAKIKKILKKKNDTNENVDDIFDDALTQVNDSVELYSLSKEIRDNFDHDQIVEIFEFMWEIVLADGEIDDFESGLIRKACGLFHVSGKESSEAKNKAIKNLKER